MAEYHRSLPARAALTAAFVAIAVVTWLGPRLRSAWRPTDFDREVQGIDADLTALHSPTGQSSSDAATKLAYRLYHRATLTSRSDDFLAAQTAADRALEAGPSPDLRRLRSTIDLRFHRLDSARLQLDAIAEVGEDEGAQLLLADVDLQRGAYDTARSRIERVLERAPTWDARVRLASLDLRRGDVAGADRLYAEAEDDLTAKEMRAFAWVEVQWGYLYFSRGRYDEAR